MLKKYLHLINLFDDEENLIEINRILQTYDDILKFRDGNGNSLLHHAISKQKRDIAVYLIEKGLDLHEKNLVILVLIKFKFDETPY